MFQVQTMILAVSGSTANTADPLDGNGVTPVFAGPQLADCPSHVICIFTNNQDKTLQIR